MSYIEIGYQTLFFVIGTPINVYSLVRIVQARRRRRNGAGASDFGANSWLLLLALHLIVADLLILILYCFGKTLWLVTFFWYGGAVLCKAFLFSSTFGYYLWSYLVVVAAADMWYCACFPLKCRRIGSKRVRHWIWICWGLATVFSVPQLIVWGQVDVPANYTDGITDKAQCIFLYSGFSSFPRDYQIYHAFTVFYIPLLCIISVHIGLAFTLYMKNSQKRKGKTGSVDRNVSNISAASIGKGSSKRRRNTSWIFVRQLSAKDRKQNILSSITSVPSPSQPSSPSPNQLTAAATVRHSSICPNQLQTQQQYPRRKKSSFLSIIGEAGGNGGSNNKPDPNHLAVVEIRTNSNRKKQKRSRARFFKTTVSVILTFALTWLPYQIVALKRIFCGPGPKFSADWNGCIDSLVSWEWLEGIMILGACLNPFIYRFHSRAAGGGRNSMSASVRSRTHSMAGSGGAGGHHRKQSTATAFSSMATGSVRSCKSIDVVCNSSSSSRQGAVVVVTGPTGRKLSSSNEELRQRQQKSSTKIIRTSGQFFNSTKSFKNGENNDNSPSSSLLRQQQQNRNRSSYFIVSASADDHRVSPIPSSSQTRTSSSQSQGNRSQSDRTTMTTITRPVTVEIPPASGNNRNHQLQFKAVDGNDSSASSSPSSTSAGGERCDSSLLIAAGEEL